MVVLAGLATAGVAVYLGSQLFAQQGGQTAPAPSAVKIGVVNLTAVVKGYEKSKLYKDEIERLKLQFEKKDNDYRTQLKTYQDWLKDPKNVTHVDRDKVEGYVKVITRQMQ